MNTRDIITYFAVKQWVTGAEHIVCGGGKDNNSICRARVGLRPRRRVGWRGGEGKGCRPDGISPLASPSSGHVLPLNPVYACRPLYPDNTSVGIFRSTIVCVRVRLSPYAAGQLTCVNRPSSVYIIIWRRWLGLGQYRPDDDPVGVFGKARPIYTVVSRCRVTRKLQPVTTPLTRPVDGRSIIHYSLCREGTWSEVCLLEAP